VEIIAMNRDPYDIEDDGESSTREKLKKEKNSEKGLATGKGNERTSLIASRLLNQYPINPITQIGAV
jgi:hypothetical protein